jgi:leader peptidase (prepilin peptidase)/N-methyltransferase
MPLDPYAVAPVLFVFGLAIGSFLNVVIVRLPIMMERQWRAECAEALADEVDTRAATASNESERFDLVAPRSHCPHCGASIRARDNIPLISWLALKGRCRHCGAGISVQYPLVELASGVIAVVVLVRFGPGWEAALAILFSWALLAAAAIDWRTTLLPDDLTLPLLWLGLLAAAAGLGEPSAVAAIVGAAVGYLLLWGLYHAFRLATGKEGMGHGDFKLLAALGAWTGWQGLPVTILLSSFVGAIMGLAMMALRGHDRSVPIPFGPFLAAGGWVSLLWGDALTAAYIQWSMS